MAAPAISGVEADGFIWGRGSQDNKSGVIAILEAVEPGEGRFPTYENTLACFRSRRRNRWSKWCRQDCGLLGDQEYQAGRTMKPFVSEGPSRPCSAFGLIGVAEKATTVDLHFKGEGGIQRPPVIVRLREWVSLYRLEQEDSTVMTAPMRALFKP